MEIIELNTAEGNKVEELIAYIEPKETLFSKEQVEESRMEILNILFMATQEIAHIVAMDNNDLYEFCQNNVMHDLGI